MILVGCEEYPSSYSYVIGVIDCEFRVALPRRTCCRVLRHNPRCSHFHARRHVRCRILDILLPYIELCEWVLDWAKGHGVWNFVCIFRDIGNLHAIYHRSHAQQVRVFNYASRHYDWPSRPNRPLTTTSERPIAVFGAQHCRTDRLELFEETAVLDLLYIKRNSRARILLPITLSPVICDFHWTQLIRGGALVGPTQHIPSLGST